MQQEQLLLDAIRDDPDDRENYAVYGDWLAQRGDPRGELIGLSLALERTPDPKLAKRVEQLVRELAKALPRGLDVVWKLGFVSEIRLDGVEDVVPRKRRLDVLRHPHLQFLESLSLVEDRITHGRQRASFDTRLMTRVLEIAPRTLRRLEISNSRSAFLKIENLVKLLDHFPRLTELAMYSERLPAGLATVLAPRLRALELSGPALSDKLIKTIATAEWPHLHSLALRLPRRSRANMTATPLAPMMRQGFPALVDLRVREIDRASVFTERFCLEIVRSPLLAQLEVLDFTVRDLDVDVVRPSHPQLRHLRSFLPSAEDETDLETLQQLTYLLEEPDTHRAIRLTRKVREMTTRPFDLHNINRRLGTALSLIGELDESLAALDASLENEPECGVSLNHKAWTLKRLGRIDEASEVLQRAETTQRHPPMRCGALYLRASLDMARGITPDPALLEEARQLFAEELPTSVVDADLHYELACLRNLMGDAAGAIEMLAATLELCPHYKAWAATEIDFASLRDTEAFCVLLRDSA